VETLLDAVVAAGLDLRTATPEALAPLDQFHGGGKDATRALAGQAEVTAGMRVLDVGGGLGGPARMLAVEYGARVTVLDLTTDYLRAGTVLTTRMGLTARVHFCCGHALQLPFPNGSFDLVWTQNSGMQIAHKAQLYCEFFRVLRAAGRLAGFIERYWHPTATFRESAPSAGPAPRTIQALVMGEHLAAIQEARARNAAEDRLRSVLLVCERP
jgi:ubiquinone/menaquinone biosynthesis C-methylase UbiE